MYPCTEHINLRASIVCVYYEETGERQRLVAMYCTTDAHCENTILSAWLNSSGIILALGSLPEHNAEGCTRGHFARGVTL